MTGGAAQTNFGVRQSIDRIKTEPIECTQKVNGLLAHQHMKEANNYVRRDRRDGWF